MDEHTKRLLKQVYDACNLYLAKNITLDELQRTASGVSSALEGVPEIAKSIHNFAGEIEYIRAIYGEYSHHILIESDFDNQRIELMPIIIEIQKFLEEACADISVL